MTLNQLPEGETARIESLGMEGRLRRRLMDIGMIPGTRVECLNGGRSETPSLFLCAERSWRSGLPIWK